MLAKYINQSRTDLSFTASEPKNMLYHHAALLVIVLIASSGVFLAVKLAVSMNRPIMIPGDSVFLGDASVRHAREAIHNIARLAVRRLGN